MRESCINNNLTIHLKSGLIIMSYLVLFHINMVSAQSFTGIFNTSIPDNNPVGVCASISVSGIGTIDQVYGITGICLFIEHTWDSDLSIYLSSPSGTTVLLSSGNGSNGDNYGTVVPGNCCFTMGAATSITAGSAPFIGDYIPEEDLGNFNNGQNADGDWSLCVYDNAGGDAGILLGFSITFGNTPYESTPSCYDGIMNQNETGIDCGGPCPSCNLGATCADSYEINSVPFVHASTTCGKGDDYNNNDACGTNYLNGDDYVYSFTPASDQTISINLDADVTWVGVVVTEGCPDQGTCVITGTSATNTFAEINSITLSAGITYYITISTYPTPQCIPNYTLTITVPAPPSNDEPCSAISLTPSFECNMLQFSNSLSSGSETPDPGCGNYMGNDVWFSTVVPPSGELVIDTYYDFIDNGALAVYEGTDCNSLTLIGCDESSGIFEMPMLEITGRAPGETLWIRFWSENNSQNGTFEICIKSWVNSPSCTSSDPAGDHCDVATTICSIDGYCGNTSSTYDNIGDPSIFCVDFGDVTIENSSWISFVADNDTAELYLFVSNCSAGEGIQVQVLGTSDCVNFTAHSSCFSPGYVSNGEIVATNLIIGETYYIMVDGYNGDVCDYVIAAGAGVWVPDAICLETGQNTGLSCNGDPVHLQATGGNAYNWSPVSGLDNPNIATPTATPLQSTTYYVTITNGSISCPSTMVDSVIVYVSDIENNTSTSTIDASCGNNNGSATIMVTGEMGPYLYQWDTNSGNQSSPSVTGLSAGTYSITISDNIGCNFVESVSISASGNIDISLTSLTEPSCNESFDGGAIIAANGGSPPYSYAWSPNAFGQNTVNISYLASGTYTVTVSDNTGCTNSFSFEIQPVGIISTQASITDEDCGDNNGIIVVTINGATPPLNYYWSTGAINSLSNNLSDSISNLTTGTYTITVSDINGCTQVSNFLVSGEDTKPVANINVYGTISCSNTTAILDGSNSTGNLLIYSWTTTDGSIISNASQSICTVSEGGWYYLKVTDSFNCSDTASAMVLSDTAAPVANAGPVGTINCTNATAILDGTLSTPGNISFSWTTQDGNIVSGANTASPIVNNSGSYNLVVLNPSNGCMDSDLTSVLIDTMAPASIISENMQICSGDTVQISVNGGDIFSWSTGENDNTITVWPISDESYSVTVTDISNGCTTSLSTLLTVVGNVIADAGSNIQTCANDTIVLTASGGIDYLWQDGSTNSQKTIVPFVSEWYYVTVSIGSCGSYDSVLVEVFPYPNIEISTFPSSPICLGDSIMVSVSGADQFMWTEPIQEGAYFFPDAVGVLNYTLTGTNHSICSTTDSLTITVFSSPILDLQEELTLCRNSNLSLNPGVSEASLLWSDGSSSPTLLVETDGYYSVTATSSDGCTSTASSLISISNNPIIEVGPDITINQNTPLHIHTTSDQLGYSYYWSPETFISDPYSDSPVFQSMVPTQHTLYLTATNEYNCESTDTLYITVIEETSDSLILYNIFTPNNDGDNDTWHIENIEKYPDNEVIIYNRNGSLIYSTSGYLNNTNGQMWDGKYNGTDAPESTYYYIVKESKDGAVHKGYVTIVR